MHIEGRDEVKGRRGQKESEAQKRRKQRELTVGILASRMHVPSSGSQNTHRFWRKKVAHHGASSNHGWYFLAGTGASIRIAADGNGSIIHDSYSKWKIILWSTTWRRQHCWYKALLPLLAKARDRRWKGSDHCKSGSGRISHRFSFTFWVRLVKLCKLSKYKSLGKGQSFEWHFAGKTCHRLWIRKSTGR